MNSPYIQMQDLGGENPMMQNIAQQQAMYQQNMSNLGNLGKQALDTKGTQVVQFDQKSMADALRAGQNPQQPANVYDYSTMTPDAYSQMASQYYGNTYNPNSGWSA